MAQEEIVLRKVSVEERLPECPYQHGKTFSSGEIITTNIMGELGVNEYLIHYNSTSNGFEKLSENWMDREIQITHWYEEISLSELYASSIEEKEAIGFAEWTSKNNWTYSDLSKKWMQQSSPRNIIKTPEELYSLYKTQKA